MAEAEMDPGAEGDVPVWLSWQIEPLGVRISLRIHIGGRQHGHDPVTLAQTDTAQFDIPAHVARLCELHRRDETQKFLDREIDAAPIGFQTDATTRAFQKL